MTQITDKVIEEMNGRPDPWADSCSNWSHSFRREGHSRALSREYPCTEMGNRPEKLRLMVNAQMQNRETTPRKSLEVLLGLLLGDPISFRDAVGIKLQCRFTVIAKQFLGVACHH